MRGSADDLPVALELADGTKLRMVEWGGMSVERSSIVEEADLGELFRGLPDDRCQCPHWGYVIKGELSFHFADREEVFRAGDAYYVGPGHLPLLGAGVEYVEFSPADKLQATMEIVERNFAATANPVR